MDLYDLVQRRQIQRLNTAASQNHGMIESQRRSSELSAEHLHERLDRMVLVCEAMWVLLRENSAFTDEHLAQTMDYLDSLDGKVDDKYVRTSNTCTTCEAKVPLRSKICQFCGNPAPVASGFAGV